MRLTACARIQELVNGHLNKVVINIIIIIIIILLLLLLLYYYYYYYYYYYMIIIIIIILLLLLLQILISGFYNQFSKSLTLRGRTLINSRLASSKR